MCPATTYLDTRQEPATTPYNSSLMNPEEAESSFELASERASEGHGRSSWNPSDRDLGDSIPTIHARARQRFSSEDPLTGISDKLSQLSQTLSHS